MEFSPSNHVVKLCLQGMELENSGQPAEARQVFLNAWDAAANDSERFIAAHYVARHQESVAGRVEWLETGLRLASTLDNESVTSAFPPLHAKLAEGYETLGFPGRAAEHRALAASRQNLISDRGPFYHGTRAALQVGDLLTPGGASNYQAELRMNHIYFTALVNGAALAAALANGSAPERVYIVEPTGPFENDPNVTNNKFPGNPTRSYRSLEPLKIVGEATAWAKLTPQQQQEWRAKVSKSRGAIIN
jgi:rifampin ADP-ribosylating transferase